MVVAVVAGANTNLQRVLGHYQAFFQGVVENGAVVKARALFVGVGMGIKMDQRQWAVLASMGAQQWQTNVVVATQREHFLTRF